ncbi:8290_t:CDS:2, partial [Gigaspora margarita]
VEMVGQIFATKKDILNIVQEIARSSGFAVTTKSSGNRHFHLQCKRGGQPRNTSNLTVDTRQKKKMSKRCGCPYLLKAIPRNSKWQVTEVINKHNHSMAKDARVFSEHRQLKREAKCTVVQMLKAGAKPSMIYEAIRDEDGEPTATRRDISNLGARLYLSEENASMEALILGMEKRGYTVRPSFFCHSNAIKSARRFSEVILIDATYKTNVYKLPFVNIVGISNLGINQLQTFGIAGAWISDESEKSYIWVAEMLASIIFFDIIPLVFVTDNDAALIGALKKNFPQSEHLLCTWHILNNFKKNLRRHFVNDSFDEIIKIVDCLIHSNDYEAFNLAVASYKKLALLSSNASEVVKYLDRKVKEKWVGIYTSKMMHFGATTTQRVEGAHPAMKRAIETSGSLTKSFNSLDRWLRLHHEEYLLQCENESVNIDPLLTRDDKNRLEPLLGKVAQFALNKIKNELLSVTTYKACSVMLSIIPKRWLLFPDKDQANYNYIAKDASSTSFDNFSLKSQLYKIEARYVNFPDEQQKSTLLKSLDDILAVPETKLSEMKISEKITGKGRPSGTKRLPTALEHMEAENKKMKIWNAKKKQIKNVDSLQNVSRLNIEDQICNPKSDGNCGFRALAIAIRGNEDNWNLVKLAMNGQLNKRLEVYKHWLGYDVDLLRWILESRESPCSSSLWFLSPDCAQLAADTFSLPIAIFNEDNERSMMFFPLESAPMHRKNPIILHFMNENHIVYVSMKSYVRVNWPMVNVQHKSICQRYGLEDHWSKLFAV